MISQHMTSGSLILLGNDRWIFVSHVRIFVTDTDGKDQKKKVRTLQEWKIIFFYKDEKLKTLFVGIKIYLSQIKFW